VVERSVLDREGSGPNSAPDPFFNLETYLPHVPRQMSGIALGAG
jgi:hypothetical protein